jgi:hypothetical protein
MYCSPWSLRRSRLLAACAVAGLLAAPLSPLSTASVAHAQQPAPLPQSLSELVRVKDDVYAFRYQNHVAMFIPTDDYVAVYYPAQKVLMLVDQVRVKTIAFGDLQAASPERMAEHLQYMADNFDFDALLWGHGAGPILVGTKQDPLDHRQYYIDLMEAVSAARAAGHPDNSEAMVGAVRTALAPKYSTWGNFPNGLAGNVAGVVRWSQASGG